MFIVYDVTISKPFGEKSDCKDLWVIKLTKYRHLVDFRFLVSTEKMNSTFDTGHIFQCIWREENGCVVEYYLIGAYLNEMDLQAVDQKRIYMDDIVVQLWMDRAYHYAIEAPVGERIA